MRYGILPFLLGLFLLPTACKEPEPDIEVACEMDNFSNYVLKWDLYPLPEKGEVAIYQSTDPDRFDTEQPPVKRAPVTDGITKIVPTCGLERLYFLLRFNGNSDRIVGTRSPQLNNVQNFRDVGGYRTADNRFVRWGKLYRSGSLDHIDSLSAKRMQFFQIRTLIDFRENAAPFTLPQHLSLHKLINLPVHIELEEISRKIEAEEAKRGDAVLCMEDTYLSLIEKEKPVFRSLFKLLADRDNYPIVLTDYYGKDIVGFGIALLFYALGVPEEAILDDYLLSNIYFDKQSASADAYRYSPDTQEAITTMLNADPRYLTVTLKRIKRQYGSVDQYLEKELELTPGRKRRIQRILLTP